MKSPKIYIRDSGLLHALLDFQPGSDLRDQSWVGYSWEGFVIEQILSTIHSLGDPATPYFLRTSTGAEIDLIFSLRGSLIAVEIKLTTDPDRSMLKTLDTLGSAIGAKRKVLLHFGNTTLQGDGIEVINLPNFLDSLRERQSSRQT